jgi:hypothetical protein
MSDTHGLTFDNKVSTHCEGNTGPKVYQVIEFDTGLPHEHFAILWYLAKRLPLCMIVYSGGKSLHGWFNVRGQPDSIIHAFFCDAVALGADPKMWSRCQFSRIPAGKNGKSGRQQEVLLFHEPNLKAFLS